MGFSEEEGNAVLKNTLPGLKEKESIPVYPEKEMQFKILYQE
jgi:hypothetical protein